MSIGYGSSPRGRTYGSTYGGRPPVAPVAQPPSGDGPVPRSGGPTRRFDGGGFQRPPAATAPPPVAPPAAPGVTPEVGSGNAQHQSVLGSYDSISGIQNQHIAELTAHREWQQKTLAEQMKAMGYQDQQIAVIAQQMAANKAYGEQMNALLDKIVPPGPGTAVSMVGY